MQLVDPLGFHTWLTQFGCPAPAVTVSRGVGVVLVQMSCYPLVFLPSGFCTLPGCVCMSDSSLLVSSWGWVGGYLLRTLFLWACSVRCFPCCWFPWGFQVTGGLYFCFPGDVGWASALPYFSGLLLIHFLARVVGVLLPVSGCSSGGVVCLVCR